MQKQQKSTNQTNKSPSSSKLISKDLKKLVFNFNNDEDENEEQSFDNQEFNSNKGDKRISSSLTKLEKYGNVKGATNAKIMPSIMSVSQCLEDNYVWEAKKSPKFGESQPPNNNDNLSQQNDSKILLCSTRNQNKNKSKLKTRKTLGEFKIFDEDDDTEPQIVKQSGQKSQDLTRQIVDHQNNRPQVKTERCQKNISGKEQQIQFTNPQQKYQFKKQKIQIMKEAKKIELFFDENTENLEEEVNNGQTSNLLFNLDSDEQRHYNNEDSNTNNGPISQSPQILSSLATCADEQPDYHPRPQMLNQQPKTKQLSDQLSQKISKSESVQNIKAFLMSPVPQEIVLTFQIHKYKNFMKTQYHLQLVHPNNGQNQPGTQMMTLFAVALNDKIYIEKSLFSISVFVKDRIITEERKQEIFLGLLVSDFKRENYTMYDHKNIEKPNEITDKVICTVSTITNHLHPKLPTQELYTPGPCSSHSQMLLPNNSITKNLKKMYKIPQLKHSVTRYTTHAVPEQILDQIREEHKVARNTTKHALIKNGNGKIKVVFLKVSNNRFRVRVGGGLTPMQAFCYGIVHLQ